MLRLLHLSDIHFGGYGPHWDDHEDQRDQLIADVEALVTADAHPIDGILIGGDIAFAGKPGQYVDAGRWISDLIQATGCPERAVWMVPGNHDVDRDTVDGSHICREFRQHVRGCPNEEVDDLLKARLAMDDASPGLIQPFKAYNDFAFGHGCAFTAREPFWWDDTLDVGGATVLLWGVNSALVSDAADADRPDAEPNLVLGTHQSKVRERWGKVRIVICHHPPSHIRDWAKVAPYFARAHIVLFGHVHRQEANQAGELGCLHVHAGAVGPQHGAECAPSYNLLSLELDAEVLRAIVQTRVWSHDSKRFGPSSEEPATFPIALDLRTLVTMPSDPAPRPSEDDGSDELLSAAATPLTGPQDSSAQEAKAPAPEEAGDAARLRELAFRYLSAPATRRLDIARALGVLTDEDMALTNDRERYATILRRIRDEELIDELAKELGI
jgi:Calcineurin-like phosphoesterase/GTPase-associated adaptor domain